MTGQAETGQAETGQAETGQADARRAGLVAAAQERWAAALTDLGGRNTLLYYKDRRAGTLDLAAAAPEALDRLQRSGLNDPSMSPAIHHRAISRRPAPVCNHLLRHAPAGAPRPFRVFCYKCGLCRSRYAAFVTLLCGHL